MEALPGDSVLDPFCGGGTVLIESLLAGRRTLGRDVSPIALLVSRGRSATPSAEVVTAFRSAGRKIAAAARQAADQPSRTKVERVHNWYSADTLRELEAIRRGVVHAAAEVQPLRWLDDTAAWTRRAVDALRPGGHMVIVIEHPTGGSMFPRRHSWSIAAALSSMLL